MEGDFQVCGNCRRSVPSAHFTIHEAHCLRFLVFCAKCKEPVPVVKMREHCEQRHAQTKECQGHSVKFKFCDLTVHFSKLETHESHCDSQTEHCPHCGKLLLLWQLAQHKDVCQHQPALLREGKGSERKIYCNYCNKMIIGSMRSHYVEANDSPSQCPKNLRTYLHVAEK